MALSAARLSFPDVDTAETSTCKNSKTRGFPSPDCSGFGYFMGEQTELLMCLCIKKITELIGYNVKPYMESIDIKYEGNKELRVPIKNCVIVRQITYNLLYYLHDFGFCQLIQMTLYSGRRQTGYAAHCGDN